MAAGLQVSFHPHNHLVGSLIVPACIGETAALRDTEVLGLRGWS